MKSFTRARILGALLIAIALAAGAGVVLSQGAPESQSDNHLPCTAHPCEGYVYEVQYYTADGKIKGAVARDGRGDAPPPGSGILPQPGTKIMVLTDPDEIRLFGRLQDYDVDLTTLTLRMRADSQPVPSVTGQSQAFPSDAVGVLPSLALASGIGLAALVLVRTRRRGSR